MAHLVIAEDDPKQAALVRLYAESEGHDVVVVGDGRSALDEVRRRAPDVLVLDVMMPRLDGLDVCRVLRAESDVPILLLTARSSEDDLLLGLDLGADDYVTKPYSPRELMGRVRALARRGRRPAQHAEPEDADVVRCGPLTVDPGRHEVTYRGAPVPVTRSELTVLDLLARRAGRVFEREQLMEHLHGTSRYVSRRTVDMHVLNLRRKLDDARGLAVAARAGDEDLAGTPGTDVEIATVYGVGYKLVERAGA